MGRQKEEWYFSVIDVVAALTKQPGYDGARNYWKVIKKRLSDEGSELVTSCNQLKMKSPKDGKSYKTDVEDTSQLLRIINNLIKNKQLPNSNCLHSISYFNSLPQLLTKSLKKYS